MMSQRPASAVRALRAQSQNDPLQRTSSAPDPVVAAPVMPPPPRPAVEDPREMNMMGPRKLIRPTLPARALRARRFQRHDEPVLAAHAGAPAPMSPHDASSHAEAFYFQKQAQTQTPMVFVLEDGEKIEGCIEWYDRNAIKVRSLRSGASPSRVLIYKSSIKYLYKAGENQPF